MTIIERYLAKQVCLYLALSLVTFTALFMLFDFFDRIDNLVGANASVGLAVQYFLFKIPLTVNLMLPVSMLVATLFSFGLLSKNSEITAMRAAGIPLRDLAKPLLVIGLCVSAFALLLNETIVPSASRRVREIYNIDIKQKHKAGTYNQNNFWWRDGQKFYNVALFDSRANSLLGMSMFELSEEFRPSRRTDAERASFVSEDLGWSLRNLREYQIKDGKPLPPTKMNSLALPIRKTPQDFYDVRGDRNTMSYRQLKRFINSQKRNGIAVTDYYADLYEKFAFPFVNVLCAFVALPFALRPARSGSMASSILAGMAIGFSYYAVHYLSLSFGRSLIWPPLMAAWMANLVLGAVGLILNLGAESPR